MVRFILYAAMFAVSLSHTVSAGTPEPATQTDTLSLAQAVDLALQRSFRVELQRTMLARQQAIHKQATLLPNPILNYTHEYLLEGQRKTGEWTLTAGYPLAALITRGAHVDASTHRLHAAEHRAGLALRQLRFDVERAFLDHWEARTHVRLLIEVETILHSLEAAARARSEEGDISQYASRRIGLEGSRLRWKLVKALKRRRETGTALALLLTVPADSLSGLALSIPEIDIPDFDEDSLIESALSGREDLLALRSEYRSFSREASWHRSRWLEDLHIGGGYKVQLDRFRGPVLELSLGLPFFNRDQGHAARALAEGERSCVEIRQLEKSIATEVQGALAALRDLREYARELHVPAESEMRDLLATASLAYAEGEFSLVEYLDATTSFIEGKELSASLHADLVAALLKVEFSVGPVRPR